MALLDSSTRISDSALGPAATPQTLPEDPVPATRVARLWGRFKGAFWTLLDQGIISLGTFLVNVELARELDAREYGTFALLFGGYFLIQLLNASLIFFPLMLRLGGGKEERSSDLVCASLILTTLSTSAFTVAVISCLIAFDRSDLAIAAAAYLLLWQLQDVLRRALLAQFRHRTAAIADAITYIGGAGAIFVLAHYSTLSASDALFVMAAACTLAIAIQVLQRPPTFPRTIDKRELLHDFWRQGKWALVNGVVLIATVQAFPWALAMADGPAAAADFQAVLNVANLANPIAFGLYNIILPAVAQAYSTGSMRSAWRVARTYIAIGAALLSLFVVPVLIMPQTVLALLYGDNSSYTHLGQAVAVMMVAAAINAIAELMNTFIHGVGSAKFAALMNGAGLVVVVLLMPVVGVDGVLGCALLLGAARFVRLIAAACIVGRMLSSEERPLMVRLESVAGRRSV